MKKTFPVALILILAGLFLTLPLHPQEGGKSAAGSSRKICITFDDLPAERTYNKSERKWINEKILAALKKHNAPAAGFVIGDNLEGDSAIVRKWVKAGHIIGFLPYSGQAIGEVPTRFFIDDVARGMETADSLVVQSNQQGRYFRYPYLQYGDTPEMRKEIEEFFDYEHVTIAHVSVVTEDFVYNLSLEKLVGSDDSARFRELRKEYVSHILHCLSHAENLAKEVAGRRVRQIIQLHANRINAMFLDSVLDAIFEKGYRFVSLEAALQDEIYRQEDAYYLDQNVSYLERLKLSNPDLMPAVKQ
jgi:peptidoglycan/xylan/chitin deacetylase (PgdA/CDA1 family)